VRLSTELKGKDYRALWEIVDLTYGASCPDALFPPLFEKLAKAIGCNSVVYLPVEGAGLPRAEARGSITVNTSLQLAREYADYYWALDPSCITRWTKEPNCAVRITDLIPASRFTNSEFAIDFAARVPYCWGLGGTVGMPGHPIAAMALHRLRHDRDFSERDVAFLRALLPHVSRALYILQEQNRRPRSIGVLILNECGTAVYCNRAAADILKDKSPEAIPFPIGQAHAIFQSDPGDYTVGVQTIPGNYKVVSLEPVTRDTLRSRLAVRGLTPRQQEIASRVLRGMSNKRIAGELGLSEQTVKDHINAIFRKLGIHHRAELAARVLPMAFDDLS